MSLSIIVAYDQQRAIGVNNTLPWRLPSDLAHFKKTTLGHPVIMGRKTWESLGRPLPGRLNVVITQNPQYTAQGARIVHSLEEAMALVENQIAFIIGGEQIYTLALGCVDKVYATEVHTTVQQADAFFPQLPTDQWEETSRQAQPSENGLDFDFVLYQRILSST